MLKFYSIDDLLERRDSTVFRSDDEQYRIYVFSTFRLFRRKLREGALLDCQRIGREIQDILKESERFHPSALLLSQLRIMFLEFYLKRKNLARYEQFYKLLRTTLRDLKQSDRQIQLVKINSLILFDFDFEVMPHEGEHSCVEVITLYKQNHTLEAIELMKHYLNEYEDYVAIKKVIIGRWLLELSKLEAFEWLFEVLHLQKHEYQRYEARVLFVSGYRALNDRMKIDMSKCRLKNIDELQRNYAEELKRTNQQCSIKKIEEFKKEYALGFDSKLSVVERKNHLSKALDLVAKLPCYPNPSIYEFDCRVKLVQECIDSGSYDQCKGHIEVVIRQGNELQIFNWKREMKVSQSLAVVFEHEGNLKQAAELVDRCMELEPDQNKKIVLGDWKASLKSKSSGKNVKKVEVALSRSPRQLQAKPSPSKGQKVGSGKLVHGQNNLTLTNEQEHPLTERPPAPAHADQKSCCSVM